jgi:hemerythrin
MEKVSSAFPWRNEFNLNVKEMDKQHRVLVGIISTLQQAVKNGEGKLKLAEVLESLLAYTDKHFAAEEKLMKKHGYPGYNEHKSKHIKMRGKVLSLIKDYNDGRVTISFSVLTFLQNWLSKHIMETDMKYAAYLNKKGVS